MFKRKPILPGHSDIHQAQVIFEMVGSPNEKVMPGWEKLPGADLVKSWGPEHGKLEKVFRE
jgi:serine/threonine-protein kinase BUR1